eukprot:7384441-Prymnesium_polylepis.1
MTQEEFLRNNRGIGEESERACAHARTARDSAHVAGVCVATRHDTRAPVRAGRAGPGLSARVMCMCARVRR